MPQRDYDHFRKHDSEVVSVPGPPSKSSDSLLKPPPESFDVLKRVAVKINNDGKVQDVSNKFFARCVFGNSVFYIEFDEFVKRVGGKGLRDTYEADWKVADKSGNQDNLSCPGWTPKGERFGAGKNPVAWPQSLIARGQDPDQRFNRQLDTWMDIAGHTEELSMNTRLWKVPTSMKLRIYFAPMEDWLTKDDIEKLLASLPKDSKTGLECHAISKEDAAKDKKLITLSKNLFGHYQSLMTIEDLDKLIEAQMKDRDITDGWLRKDPHRSDAEDFNAKIFKKSKPTDRQMITITVLASEKPDEARKAPVSFMGKQWANKWANEVLWTAKEASANPKAEWLHRSAYGLGDMTKGNFQSPDNIVFGTYESNSDMTRAEAMLGLVMDRTNATGRLYTKLPSEDNEQVDIFGSRARPIPKWMKKYSWLAPKLKYYGDFKFAKSGSAVPPLRFSTAFFTFSCYTPLTIEGRLDKLIFDKFVATYGLGDNTSSTTEDSGMDAEDAKLELISSVASASSILFISSQDDTSTSIVTGLTEETIPIAAITSSDPGSLSPMLVDGVATQNSKSASQAKLLDIIHHPVHQEVWHAISNKAAEVVLHDTKITGLKTYDPETGAPSDPPQGSPPPSGGFVLTGTIDLFGLPNLKASLKSWHGPPPPNVTLGSELPIFQQAEVKSLAPGDFIPLLKRTEFNDFKFKDVIFTYQNYEFEPNTPLGLSLTAKLPIGENRRLSSFITEVLHIHESNLELTISAALGLGHKWHFLPSVSSFTVEGLFDLLKGRDKSNTSTKLSEGVTWNRIGLRIFGVRSSSLEEETAMEYGFAFFGDMNITIPGSKKPLEFDFEINDTNGAWQLDAHLPGSVWENAFGTGLNLRAVGLSASLTSSEPLKTLKFDLQAELKARSLSTVFSGSYSPSGDYSISASIDDFSIANVLDLFNHYTGEELALPKHTEITVGAAKITVAKDHGLAIKVEKVKFDNYTTASAELELSSKGILLKGDVDDIDFPKFGFKLVKASLQVSFEKEGSSKSSDVALAGEIELEKVKDLPKISAAVHLYKSKDEEGLKWTVYGNFADLGAKTVLGKVFPVLKTTFLENVALDSLSVIAASDDDPILSEMNPQKFEIKKGVQICAVLGEILPVKQLIRRPTPNMTLKAGWSKDKGFSIGVSLPDTMIHLGRGITTDPIDLEIETKPKISLKISAGIKVPVPKEPTPLDFTASLALTGLTEIQVTGEMHGGWDNPFGISQQLVIGPDLALTVGIILPEFFSTGIPKTIGFVGGLRIGKVLGSVAVQISEDPTQEVLSGKLKKLTIIDLVSFAQLLTKIQIPMPPDFLEFEDVELYMSTGATIGTHVYPPGFSFEADLKIFDTKLKAMAQVNTSNLVVKGSLDKVSVGPLTIRGHDNKAAILDLEVGAATQKLTIDGAITFLDLDVAIFLELDILPQPKFFFDFILHFTHMLTFEVQAKMIGSTVDLNTLKNLDFELYALFRQHLLDYVRTEVKNALERARKAAKQKIEEAKKEVQVAEANVQSGISAAQSKVDQSYQTWLQKSKSVHDASGDIIKKYMADLKKLQGNVDTERQKYNLDLKNAESAVQHANSDRAAKMRDAEAAVTKAKTDWDANIAAKEKELEAAKTKLRTQFGHAEQDLDNAKAKVDSMQKKINDIQGTIDDYENAHWWEFWKKAAIGPLYAAKGTLMAAKAVADEVLTACHKVVDGGEYVATRDGIPLLEKALEDVRDGVDTGLSDANSALNDADKLSAAAISAANKTLEGIQHGGDAVWHAAEAELAKFITDQKPILAGAQKAIDDLVRSTEWLAYQSATAALSTAKHATHGLEVANKALALVEKGEEGFFNLTEMGVDDALNTFNITKIELQGTLKGLLGESGKHFTATIEGAVYNNAIKFNKIDVDLRKPSDFVHQIFLRLVKELVSIATKGVGLS